MFAIILIPSSSLSSLFVVSSLCVLRALRIPSHIALRLLRTSLFLLLLLCHVLDHWTTCTRNSPGNQTDPPPPVPHFRATLPRCVLPLDGGQVSFFLKFSVSTAKEAGTRGGTGARNMEGDTGAGKHGGTEEVSSRSTCCCSSSCSSSSSSNRSNSNSNTVGS